MNRNFKNANGKLLRGSDESEIQDYITNWAEREGWKEGHSSLPPASFVGCTSLKIGAITKKHFALS